MSQDLTNTITAVHPTGPDFFSEALRRVARDDMHVTRQTRRTYADMAPGKSRQPVLVLAPNVRFLPTAAEDDEWSDEPCIECERRSCPGGCRSFAPTSTGLTVVAA
ncbi:hypothetical protein ACFQ8W_01735 [Streptomyces sp. NPDC056508]|uniref:hypothetical protein n=1 Tax=Streptomyces sp. NPDC056508 TaxID=3345845 RepID=UPI0036890DF5